MKLKPILSSRQLTPLIEILIVLTFFASATAVLAQIFAKAHNDSRLAHDINNAVLFVGECAERVRTAGFDEVISAGGLPGFRQGDTEMSGAAGDEGYSAYLDSDFTAASKATAYATVSCRIDVSETAAGRLLKARFVCIRKDGEELASINTAVFYENPY